VSCRAGGARRSPQWLAGLASPAHVQGCNPRAPKDGGTLRSSSVRVRLESIVALCAGILGILTIFWHDWIEALTGWDPDQHNGIVEWIIVAGLLAVAVTMGLTARRHWKLQTQVSGN